MNLILVFFTFLYKGDWNEIYRAIERKDAVTVEQIQSTQAKIDKLGLKYISILDSDYPKWFKSAYKPPFIVFYKGNRELLNKDNYISLTGDRSFTEYHEDVAKKFSKDLFKNYALVSGLYKGMDEKVGKYAIKHDIPMILISANGLDDPYFSIPLDQIDMKKTLMFSECPPTHVTKNHLRARNRLIAAISRAIVIINAEKNSKLMNLVSHALSLGKDIMCIPDEINRESGNNELIQQGAILVNSSKDVAIATSNLVN